MEKKTGKKKSLVENKVKKVKPKKKQVILAPRTGLEPRLCFPEEQKTEKETIPNVEQNKKLVISLDTNEVGDHLKLRNSKRNLPDSGNRSLNESNESHNAQSTSTCTSNKSPLESNTNGLGEEDVLQNFIRQYRQPTVKALYWSDKEIKNLAYALQEHGFADEEKLQAVVKTKTVNDIKSFIKSRVGEMRKAKAPKYAEERHRGRPKNRWTAVTPEVLKSWPAVRKWRRIAYEQMLPFARAKDYSKPVISALCEKFYEEAEEPSESQVIDVKLMYKYIGDCMNGKIPPQLPPKESALMLDLLQEVRSIPLLYDFEEERKFIKDFRQATKFKPFEVKDEFKKRLEKGPEIENNRNTVSVPDEIFLELSRHKRLMQSFNPLVIPTWMLHKEQEYVENYLKESLY